MSAPTGRWRFRAADGAGVMREGWLDASDATDALDQLRRQSLWPVDVAPVGGATAVPSASTRGRRERRSAALASAMRALSAMLDGGTPLADALALVAQDASHPTVATLFETVRQRVLAGVALSDAFGEHAALPPLVAAMTSAGEASGQLGLTLGRVADDLDERVELEGQVRAALLYPLVLAVAAVLGLTLLLTVVVPRFARILANSGQPLPWSTQLVVGASGALARWWWVLLPAVGLAVALLRRWVSQPDGRRAWHAARLRWPLIGPLEESAGAARVLRTLGLLLPTGVPLLTALDIARTSVGNVILAERLAAVSARLRDGASLGSAFAGALPALGVQLLAAGEQGGDLGALAARGAVHFEQRTRRALRSTVALVEPAIIVLFGGLVAFVAVAMLQAIYGLNARAL